MSNTLYYGDNLPVLKQYIKDESVDLIYLDPPFNSKANYNVLFEDYDGEKSAAQLEAFKDTWTWAEAALTYEELSLDTGPMGDALRAFGSLLHMGGMLAYLTMMAPRLKELRRVLKHTGSIYLHCDPTASSYLKILMDAIYGPKMFRNEIIWQRTSAHANVSQKFGSVHDVILYYCVSDKTIWNQQYVPYDDEYLDTFFDQIDDKGKRYARRDLTAAMAHASSGQLYTWKGITPPPSRCWAMTKENMDKLEAEGRIHWPKKAGGMPRLKLYPDDLPGVPLQDIWADIKTLGGRVCQDTGTAVIKVPSPPHC